MLKLLNITKKFSEVEVLNNFNLEVVKGEILVILGPSGSGKTTILNIIAGVLNFDNGLIEKKFSKVGYVFQEDRLLPWLSIEKNVSIVSDDTSRVSDILHTLKLSGYAKSFPDKLSGGMKQRVSIARAYNYSSELVLMDEPFKSLDYKLKVELVEDLINKWKHDHNTYIIVTHDEKVASKLATRILLLSHKPTKIISELLLDKEPQNRSNVENNDIEKLILGDDSYEKEL